MITAERSAAARVVAIQNTLARSNPDTTRRRALLDEQRRLWDSEFEGRSFEQIAAIATRH